MPEKNKICFKSILLLVQVFIVSTCSLTYELLMGTATSNITGNSVLAFSLVIGLFLAGLGSGAFASRWISDSKLNRTFIWTESVLALLGGFSVTLLYFSLVFTPFFQAVQIFLIFAVGATSGLEIPLLSRILNNQENYSLRRILANVLSFDYLGGLAASLLFPLILLPYFGLVRLSFLTGLLNVSMSALALYLFWQKTEDRIVQAVTICVVFTVLVSGTIFANDIYNFAESRFYRDPIIYSLQTKYQRLVVTKNGRDIRLFINGSIQFSSLDEYRYHESLTIPPVLASLGSALKLRVAIFGGGDGLAVKQLLKFAPEIEKIYLIDIDTQMTDLAKNSTIFKNLNENALNNSKVEILNEDAWNWIQKQPTGSLDLVVSDLPDPDDTTLAKLYSQEFFRFAKKAMTENAYFVVQSSSPLSTPKAFWSTNKTLQSMFENVLPYSVYVPSFGLWGFNLAGKTKPDWEKLTFEHNFLDSNFVKKENLGKLFELDADVANPTLANGKILNKHELKINTLDNLILTNYYQISGSEVQ